MDYTKGDLKRQIAAVVKPVLALYRFQTMGELRALLALYHIGAEEVGGMHGGRPYRGLVYTVLDGSGEKAPVPPLKASRLGGDASLEKVLLQMERSAGQMETDRLKERTRSRVQEALADAPTEEALRRRLRERHIDLCLRRSAAGRITGVTFIDHEVRCVVNGSRLGKAYSANALHERFGNAVRAALGTPETPGRTIRKVRRQAFR